MLAEALQGVLARVPDLLMLLVNTTTGPLIVRCKAPHAAAAGAAGAPPRSC